MDVDKEGFLIDLTDWNEDVARQLAIQDDIVLTENHWQVINIARNYYVQYHLSPVMRVLVKIVRSELGSAKGRSIYLMQLFSGKPARLVSKISGLPKPSNCD